MLDHSNLFALLIDGDNLQVSFVPQILDKIHEYGNPIIKNVYLNRNSLTSEWDELINEHTIQPIYVPNNTPRKNAVDIAITIDAMELLFERKDLSGFCIISSDSDFTRLADYIVRKSRFVLGMGEDKTPASFQNACSEFIRIEDLIKPQTLIQPPENIRTQAEEMPNDTSLFSGFEILFIRAYENISQDTNCWVQLSDIKDEMNTLDAEFRSSDLQYMRRFADRIADLVMSYPQGIIEVKEKTDEKNYIFHEICIDCELFKFIEAYKQIAEKEQGGWVMLSKIGSKLKPYTLNGNKFSYRGVKQLSKVTLEMYKDYPNIIEIEERTTGKLVNYAVRIRGQY